VLLLNDLLPEGNETFYVRLSNATAAGSGTITLNSGSQFVNQSAFSLTGTNLLIQTNGLSKFTNDVGGTLAVQTGDGSVTLEETDGDLDVSTGDGSVSVSGKPGTLRLHTSDGSITLRAERGTAMKDDWSLSTGDGGVAVYLPSDFAAELDAHTGDGSIRSELDVSSDGDSGRRTLKGRIGSGGKVLKIRTGDGSIRLKAS